MQEDTTAVLGAGPVGQALAAGLAALAGGTGGEPRVVDVGGGSGVWAVPLAKCGCRVTVIEPNPNALATLHRRAEEDGVAERITVVAADADSLAADIEPGSAELVLAHGVLEVVDDPAATMSALAGAAAAGGLVSVLALNKHAAVLHRALAGKFDEARRLHAAASGVERADGEALQRRFDVEGLRALHAGAGLRIEVLQGEGIVADAAPQQGETALREFELAVAASPPLRDIASRLHVLARAPAGPRTNTPA